MASISIPEWTTDQVQTEPNVPGNQKQSTAHLWISRVHWQQLNEAASWCVEVPGVIRLGLSILRSTYLPTVERLSCVQRHDYRGFRFQRWRNRKCVSCVPEWLSPVK